MPWFSLIAFFKCFTLSFHLATVSLTYLTGWLGSSLLTQT